ncbi:hypothetical protein OIU34_14820 [Pararhizobium sp. BT-229]|uniref:DUF6538 domain-containing protein n=1 Tax=Pararhizobium sp. BT-229 TaxID=2986923 RepID=UPI0021F79BFD|nr:DUF6538 domain-containing protein [Pararhizobium sp. BT-229]MCV9963179.1 hypothetical protein [Pararhizobium sp. BT-229]
MATIQHVYKRGSVYWWRRRLPLGTGSRALVRLELSLHTKELERARVVAAEVTLASYRLLPSLRHKMISPEDAKKILIQVATQHSNRLDWLIANNPKSRQDAEGKRRSEICTGWAFRFFAAQGVNARIGPNEEREMIAAGLDAETIKAIAETTEFLRDNGFAQTGRARLEAILREHDIEPSDEHVMEAEWYYLRGMSAALLNTGRRWSGVRPDDIALLNAALAGDSTALSPPQLNPSRAVSSSVTTPFTTRMTPSFAQPGQDRAKVPAQVPTIAVGASPAQSPGLAPAPVAALPIVTLLPRRIRNSTSTRRMKRKTSSRTQARDWSNS